MKQLNRIAKYVSSFVKRSWKFEDYPIVLVNQNDKQAIDGLPNWVARIDGWAICGLGDTQEEAVRDLRSRFDDYRSSRSLPRPGKRIPLEFGKASEIGRHGEFAYEFIETVVGIRPLFMSDGTSLSDFDGETPIEEVRATIKEAYGVDSASYESEPLWKLLDAVKAVDRGC